MYKYEQLELKLDINIFKIIATYSIRNELPLFDSNSLDIRQGEGMGRLVGRPNQITEKAKIGCFVNLD